MSAPCRIQLSRKKGFRLPPNTVSVARPTRWGNPVRLDGPLDCFNVLKLAGPKGARSQKEWRRDACAEAFRLLMTTDKAEASEVDPDTLDAVEMKMVISLGAYPKTAEIRRELAGKSLACWCPLDAPCHADVLLEIANGGGCAAGVPDQRGQRAAVRDVPDQRGQGAAVRDDDS